MEKNITTTSTIILIIMRTFNNKYVKLKHNIILIPKRILWLGRVMFTHIHSLYSYYAFIIWQDSRKRCLGQVFHFDLAFPAGRYFNLIKFNIYLFFLSHSITGTHHKLCSHSGAEMETRKSQHEYSQYYIARLLSPNVLVRL